MRLFATSKADLDWLKLAIEANKLYAAKKLGGLSPEEEYATEPGFGGQFSGWMQGEDIRGRNRPSVPEEASCMIM